MSDATLQIVLQIVSTLAVAGSMVYAALQFRGWRAAQHVANFAKIVELQLELRKMRVDDPSLATVDPAAAPAGSAEEIRGFYYNLMQLSLFEIAWFSHEHGQLEDGYFNSWVAMISEMAKRPSFRSMWDSNTTKIMDERFRQYVDNLVDGLTPARQ